MIEFDVRTSLRHYGPAVAKQRSFYQLGFCARPLAQADAEGTEIESGMSFDFSTSSATACKARAYALALASSTVVPYASAPGTTGISAIHRPSSSRSITNSNRKSRLLTDVDGLLPDGMTLGCVIADFDARLRWCSVRGAYTKKTPDMAQNSASRGIYSGNRMLVVFKPVPKFISLSMVSGTSGFLPCVSSAFCQVR